VLARAKALAGRRRATNITFKRGDINRLPLETASMDVGLLSQALHHSAEPSHTMAEAARVVRPGGRVLVLDLRAHSETWVRDKLGDRQLGFGDDTLERLLSDAGLTDVKVTVGSRRTGDPFTVLVASGTRGQVRDRTRTSTTLRRASRAAATD